MAATPNRTTLVYLLLLAAFIALVLFSNHPSHSKTRRNRRVMPGGRRIKVRLSAFDPKQHDPIAFDPIIGNYERRREDRAWEKQYFEQQYKKWGENSATNQAVVHDTDSTQNHELEKAMEAEQQPEPWEIDADYEDPEDYLNDEDQFNITDRLIVLFPLLDINPHDGFVSVKELQDWHLLQIRNALQHRTDREMDVHDKNNDGLITLKEYLPHLTEEEIEQNSMNIGGAGWYQKQFDLNDEDKDGGLNRTEFNNFLHPEDSENPETQKWLREEQIRLRDIKNDGKLDWEEFHHNVFDQIRYHEPEEHINGHDYLHSSRDVQSRKIVNSKAKFVELDKNHDWFLTEEEMVPIMAMLHPSEGSYARQQAEHLLNEADENKDKRLTLTEMLNHPYVFYSTAYEHEEFEDSHDEFR